MEVRKKLITLVAAFVLVMLPGTLAAQEPEVYFYPPFYYKETPFGYELIEKLPRDTVVFRDTVYVTDLDAFLLAYLGHEGGINKTTADADRLRVLLDSIGELTHEKLYYNFFLREDSLRKMSETFIVREFSIGEDLDPQNLIVHQGDGIQKPPARREILFRIDGNDRTIRFIRNKDAICRGISYLFTQMQHDPEGIQGINLYFPDYQFTHKRDMVQFVKSMRIMMEASRDFKFGYSRSDIPLNLIFHSRQDITDRDFLYSLAIESTDIFFIDGVDVLEHFYVKGTRVDTEELGRINLLHKIRSHFLIARYYTGDTDLTQLNIQDFSEDNIRWILEIDFPENNWEIFLFITIGILLFLSVFGITYRKNAIFSSFIYRHTEAVLIALIVITLEIVILLITIFQNMCKEYSFTIIEKHPVLIFLTPLAVVLITPVLHFILSNRKTP